MLSNLKEIVSSLSSSGSGELTTGVEVRVNHTDCPAGTDTRKRLYLKKLDDGKVIGYCHNCSSGGVISAKGRNIKSHKAIIEALEPQESKGLIIPSDTVPLSMTADRLPLGYVLKYGISEYDATNYCLWSSKLQRILYPIYKQDRIINVINPMLGTLYFSNKIAGFTMRYLGKDPSQPKHLVYLTDKEISKASYLHVGSGENIQRIVIVEDYLSAIKLFEISINHFNDDRCIICLNGTHLDKQDLLNISQFKNLKEVTIHLDNDKTGLSATQTILCELKLILSPEILVYSNSNHYQEIKLMPNKLIAKVYG